MIVNRKDYDDLLYKIGTENLVNVWNSICAEHEKIYYMNQLNDRLSGFTPAEVAAAVYDGCFDIEDKFFIVTLSGKLISSYGDLEEFIDPEKIVDYLIKISQG